MMKPRTLLATMCAAIALTACTKGQVVVTAELDQPDPDNEGQMVIRPLADLEVRLYPFDRDQVFDSLAAAASRPEPPVPDSLAQARNRVQELQMDWQTSRTEWQTIRDRLQQINRDLEGMSRTDGRYVTLFNEFRDVEPRLNAAERGMNTAFEAFDSLQKGIIEQSEQIRITREDWADEAYADVTAVMDAKLAASGGDIIFDTTGAQGTVTLMDLKPGTYWISARHELPFDELYWNVQVSVEGAEPVTVQLTRANATVRPNL